MNLAIMDMLLDMALEEPLKVKVDGNTYELRGFWDEERFNVLKTNNPKSKLTMSDDNGYAILAEVERMEIVK